MFSELFYYFVSFCNNILIFEQILNFNNFSKHSYISYLFKMFLMLALKIENFLNFYKILLGNLKPFLNCFKIS